jgi:hypothetical protein
VKRNQKENFAQYFGGDKPTIRFKKASKQQIAAAVQDTRANHEADELSARF